MAETEFDGEQFDEAYPPGIENTWWQVGRARVIARTFARHVPRTSKVLEVGCGTGIVTAHLREAGWDVNGVEIGTPNAGLHAPGHVRLGIDAVDLPAVERDGITTLALFDVIEHIEDPSAFLTNLLNAFPNAKQVIVTVPARKELWTSFDDHFGHFRRYDRDMVRDQFTNAGLTTDSAAYFFHGIYPAIVLNNLARGRVRNIRFAAPKPGLSTSINRAIGSYFAMEARVLPGALVGTSILAVGRRR